MKLKITGNRILIIPIDEDGISQGGILIPDCAREKPQEGIVAGIGPGRQLDNGTYVPIEVAFGDRVLISKYSGSEIEMAGRLYRLVNGDDILAILSNDGSAER